MSRLVLAGGLLLAIVITLSDFRPALASATPPGGPVGPAAPREPVPVSPVEPAAVEPAVDPLPFWPAPDPFEVVDALEPPVSPDAPASPVVTERAPHAAQPVAEPAPRGWTAGPPAMTTQDVISAARSLLGVPYLWGGNTTAGMDCSAYVSRAWGIPRQTTDTLHLFATPIAKEDLLPGDAMNLTRAEDPRGYGHVRIFAAWANAEHTRVWVYEETPRQSIYHVIRYDPRYTPMRRANLQVDDVSAPLIPAPEEPVRRGNARAPATDVRASSPGTNATVAEPADRTPARRALVDGGREGTLSTPGAVVRPRSEPPAVTTATAAPRPRSTPTPSRTPAPIRTPPQPTPSVKPSATPTPRATVTPTATASPAASSTPRPAATPTPTATPKARATVTPTPESRRESGRDRPGQRR